MSTRMRKGSFGEEQMAREARGFRPNSTPLLVMIGGNLLLAFVFLGIPYYLGQQQTKSALAAFGRFAACLLDAEPASPRGLGMPMGEASRFAARVLHASAEWPESCKPALHAVAPEEAVFLWPSVKQAGADVRAIVEIFDRELDAVAELREQGGAGRVPERPLLAMAKLRAGLTLMARAAGTDGSLDEDAVRFGPSGGVVEPAKLPLMAGADATLDLRMGQDGIEAIAMDGRGVSWLEVEGGELERRRFARTGLVRGTLPAEGAHYVVWAMPPKRCADAEDHCTRRASGTAAFDPGGVALPDPTWVAGHPLGRFDRMMRVTDSTPPTLEMLARADAEGHAELRRFVLIPPMGEKAPPLAPTERHELPGGMPPLDAVLLSTGTLLYAVAASEEAVVVRLWRPGAEGEPLELATLAGTSAWLTHCDQDGDGWLFYGTDRQVGAARVAGSTPVPVEAVEAAAKDALDPEDRAGDRLRAVCEPSGASVLFLDSEGRLARVRCDERACSSPVAVASDVSRFDAVAQGNTLHVAFTRSRRPEIVTLHLSGGEAPSAEGTTPAVCWDPRAGMCGQPTLVANDDRLLLAARDRADLLVIESLDEGATWRPMGGLKVGSAISTDTSAMDQHRLRKGIE